MVLASQEANMEAEQCPFLFGLIFLAVMRYQCHMLKKVPMDEGHTERMVSASYFFQIRASQMLRHQGSSLRLRG